jgi:predicted PurR-regulated permease PerM
MKIEWNKRYTTIAVYSFIVICCSIVFYSIMDKMTAFTEKISWILEILQPFIIGFVIAYLLNFILIFFEEKVLVFDSIKNMNKKGKRVISILLTYITAFTIIYLFVQFILPQLMYSIMGLVNDIPAYVTNVTKLVNELTANIDTNNEYLGLALDKWREFVNYTIEVVTNLVPILGDALKNIASSILNILLGLIISIYLLIDKENFCALNKKITYAL